MQKEFKKTVESMVAIFKLDLKSLQQDDWIKKGCIEKRTDQLQEKNY